MEYFQKTHGVTAPGPGRFRIFDSSFGFLTRSTHYAQYPVPGSISGLFFLLLYLLPAISVRIILLSEGEERTKNITLLQLMGFEPTPEPRGERSALPSGPETGIA